MSVPVPITSPDWSVGRLPPAARAVDRTAADAPVTSTSLISDAELLQELVAAPPGTAQAQSALSRIIERHGGLVYSVATRTVSDRTLADDVFQATFLVLVQSARKIQRSGSLSAWLHGTARNIGRRAISQRRARCPQAVEVEMLPACEVDPFLELERSHERDVLDEELQQLPEIDRAPLVLFYLEERSQREIAELLGISVPAVESRLKRAKQELRVRLVRRGVTLSVAVAAIGWGASAASAAPPAILVSSTLTLAAAGTTVGKLAAAGSTAASLAGKELAAMSAASKLTALVVGTAGTLTVGGALLFGAMVDGIVGPGGSGTDESAVIATEVTRDADEPGLVAQADEVKSSDAPLPQGAENSTEPSEPPIDRAQLARRMTLDLLGRTATEEEVAQFVADQKEGATRRLVDRLLSQEGLSAEKLYPHVRILDVRRKEAGQDSASDSSDQFGIASDKIGESSKQALPAVKDLDVDLFVGGSSQRPRTGPLVATYRQLSPNDKKIYQALDSPTTLEFPDNTLKEIADYMIALHNIPIRFNEKDLAEAGIDPDQSANLVISGVRLEDGLALLCDEMSGTRLGYYVDRGILHITTAEKKSDIQRLRYYDLSGCEIENLSAAVQHYAQQLSSPPESITSLGDSLAIRASLTTHDEIEEFISGAIRLADSRREAGKPQPIVPERQPGQSNPPVTPGFGGGLGGGLGGSSSHGGGGGMGGGGGGFFRIPVGD